jgi:hypothetical protein
MLERGFSVTECGKAILAACFINDLGTVTALGLIFSPLPIRTLIFVVVSVVVFVAPPFLTPQFFKKMRRTRLGTGSQVHSLLSLRHGRTCCLGRK